MTIFPKGSSKITPDSSLTTGALVMYENEQTPLFATIVGYKKQKHLLLNQRAREVELQTNRIHLLPGKLPLNVTTIEQKVNFLVGIHSEAAALSETLVIENAWELVSNEPREYSVEELAGLLFEKPTLIQYSALRLRLLSDKVFFKREKDGFSPRPEEIIAELKKAEAVRKERMELEALTVKFFHDRLKDKSTPVPQQILPLLTILEEFSVRSHGIDPARQKEAKETITLFLEQTKLQLQGDLEEKGYQLLRMIGHFTPNTNPSLIRNRPPLVYPPDALTQAEQLVIPDEVELFGTTRRNLSMVRAVTIDDSSTRDMDDALSIEQTQDGYELGIHISDVASGFAPGDALDRVCFQRATSLYFPDRTVHMLPEALSEDKLSLVSGKLRPAISCIYKLDRNLEIISSEICLSVVRIHERLSYDQVDARLDAQDHDLSLLYNIAGDLESKRIEQGAARVNRGEALVVVNADGELSLMEIDEQSPARSLVGEMMVLANRTIANFAAEKKIPIIFRGQENPDGNATVQGSIPEGPAREYAKRSILKKSTVALHPLHHSSLGVPAYAQVTSPIRRFLDLVNQRQISAYLQDTSLPYTPEQLYNILEGTNEPLGRAQTVSKESRRFWLMRWLEDHVFQRRTIRGTVIRTDLKNPLVELDEVYFAQPVKFPFSVEPGYSAEFKITAIYPHDDYLKLEVAR